MGIGRYKLADSIRQPRRKAAVREGGKPVPTHETDAEQVREAEESKDATGASVSARERMMEIGRGNQQAGRQGQ